MSKFCGVISNRQNSEELTPLEFNHLDIIADWLIDETTALHSDFNTKCEFMQEQQQKLLQNEKNVNYLNTYRKLHFIQLQLQEFYGNMQTLQTKLAATEQEVAANDCSITHMESGINALERITDRPTVHMVSPCHRTYNRQPRGEHENLLDMLQDTDNLMMHLNMLVGEIGEEQAHLQQHTSPYSTICNILDYHVQTLQKTTKNLDNLMDKTLAVDEAFLKAMNNMAAIRQQRSPAFPAAPACDKTGDGPQN